MLPTPIYLTEVFICYYVVGILDINFLLGVCELVMVVYG